MKNKFVVALVVYAALAIAAWQTIDEERFRNATLLVLAMFAVLTYTGFRRHAAEQDK